MRNTTVVTVWLVALGSVAVAAGCNSKELEAVRPNSSSDGGDTDATSQDGPGGFQSDSGNVVAPTGSCYFNGKLRPPGGTFPAADDCYDCTCISGGVSCTKKSCGGDAGVPPDGGSTETPFSPVQAWTGYVESYKFKSGADQIKMRFRSASDGTLEGTVSFGKGSPPAAASDPNVVYPPGGANGDYYPSEGYWYPLLGTLTPAPVNGNRLLARVQFNDFWAGWCGLQKPGSNGIDARCLSKGFWYKGSPDGCRWGTSEADQVPVTCETLEYCLMVRGLCSCNQDSCWPAPSHNVVQFDVLLIDGQASGSVRDDNSIGSHTIRLSLEP